MADKRPLLRLGKNPPKTMAQIERRRRAEMNRLRSTIKSQKLRMEFMQKLIAAEKRPTRRAYFYAELEVAGEKRDAAMKRLKLIKDQDWSLN